MRCTWFGRHFTPKWESVFTHRSKPEICVRCFDLIRTSTGEIVFVIDQIRQQEHVQELAREYEN
jgi:hypothetical protein